MCEGTRHVKDDARPVDDLSARVLGWSTERKIAALKQQVADADSRMLREPLRFAEIPSSFHQVDEVGSSPDSIQPGP